SAPVSWTHWSNCDAVVVFLKSGSLIRRLASLPWLRAGPVRQLPRYYQGAMTSCRPSRHASLPSPSGTSASTRSFRSSADECAAEAWSWSPGSSGRDIAEETTGSPKFVGNPDCPFAHVPYRRRQDRWHQTLTVPRRGPWSSNGKGSCEGSFGAH